jgi:Ca2+-binding RTX toxin-like protein
MTNIGPKPPSLNYERDLYVNTSNRAATTEGSDTIFAKYRNDAQKLQGGGGNDVLVGGLGKNTIDGGTGRDTVSYGWFNGSGAQINLQSGKAASKIVGMDGFVHNLEAVENAIGSEGSDKITGNNASNVFWGMGGHDQIWGNGGNDTLMGGGGHDRLFGGDGTDTLIGGVGQDTLHGGAGRDTFVVGAPHDSKANFDQILDFKPGEDTIELSIESGMAAEFWLTSKDGKTELEFGNTRVIINTPLDKLNLDSFRLPGVTLTANNFRALDHQGNSIQWPK